MTSPFLPFVGTSIVNSTAVFTFTVAGLVCPATLKPAQTASSCPGSFLRMPTQGCAAQEATALPRKAYELSNLAQEHRLTAAAVQVNVYAGARFAVSLLLHCE